jgi:transposase
VKILYWDGDGMAIWYKRLEQGTFRMPSGDRRQGHARLELSPTELVALLEGVDLASVRKTRRYRLREQAA